MDKSKKNLITWALLALLGVAFFQVVKGVKHSGDTPTGQEQPQ